MIPYFFRHYNALVDRFFIYDNGSTDGSLEKLRGDERVQVTHWDVAGDSFVDEARILTNNFWKQSCGRADWVFVVDMDEHLYLPDLRALLTQCTRDDATAIKVVGYDMVAEKFPTEDKPLWQLATRGIRFRDLDKLAIFDPNAIMETNYEVGRHVSAPTGRVVWASCDPVILLHYKRLGAEYVCDRNEILRTGLRSWDIAQRYGFHYGAAREEVVAQHSLMMRQAKPVPGLPIAAATAAEHDLEREMAVLRDSGLFQSAWYLGCYQDVAAAGKDPLEHFCLIGWREGRKANSLFDSAWYMQAYGEMIGDMNPLLDYITSGEGLGRKPAPDFDPIEYRLLHGLAYADSPLRHYLVQRGEMVPAYDELPADFDPALYLEANPDVAKAGLDPAWHFLHHGKAEGRQLRPEGG
jgi:hypothetical protein